MTTVDDARAALLAARAAQDTALDQQVSATAALRSVQSALAAAQRAGDQAAVAAATKSLGAAQAQLDLAHRGVASAAAQVSEALALSSAVTDPRALTGALDARVPALLLPVRLEIKFHPAASPAGAPERPQLWVRIFPDNCSIDTFSPELTAIEVTDARTYWGRIWQAAGDEDGERAAWRAMVTSHGSGRSAWVVDSYQPANPADKPGPGSADEVVLVLVAPAAPAAAVQTAMAAYWTAWWRAGTDTAAKDAATAALQAALGNDQAAAIATVPPFGIDTEPVPPATRATAPVTVAVAVLPDLPDTPAVSWNRAPRAVLLPDRFVLVLESGPENGAVRTEVLGLPVPPTVFTGPDPLAPQDQQPQPVNGRLELPGQLAWLADFDQAVADGLGFRVDLTPEQARSGFDRVYVVGVRALETAAESAAGLTTLLRHQYHGRAGLALVPQGTATNNTEGTDSGYRSTDDADTSFDARRAGPSPAEPDPRLRTDGQWVTNLLGLPPDALAAVPGAGGLDQRDGRAMQTLLWPATMGYLLSTLLQPVFSDATVENARWFFTRYVRGRGELPALRIGAQPYGILATTAFSRLRWLGEAPADDATGRLAFLARLHALLEAADADWAAAVSQVPSLGSGGAPVTDPQQTLLGILGLHPTSAEFQYRYAEGFNQLVNQANLSRFGELLYQAWQRAQLDRPALSLLATLGYAGARPPLLDLYFHARQAPLTGPLVDDRPTSETMPIRAWTADGRNYLQWLRDAAGSSLDALRTGAGFAAGPPPALLFLLARHALTLGYAEGARELHARAGYADSVVQAMREEPPFVHVAPEGVSESRYQPLYRHDPLISPEADWTVAAQIAHLLGTPAATNVLGEQVAALALLTDASTARLERALVEHLDTVSYRLDAWRLGLVHLQLEAMRAAAEPGGPPPEEQPPGQLRPPAGLHLGAYGWLEDVRPKPRPLVPVQLPPDLEDVFGAEPPLMRDPANGGHLLAPSLNQAVTASILRSAYIANAGTAFPEAFAVNLSSERVRAAIEIIEGVRTGQSLSALLGYALERGLHDRSGFAEVDVFIFALRRVFPLAAQQLQSTATGPSTPIDQVQARDVVDGLALVNHLENTRAFSYPFGLTPAQIPHASPTQQAALAAEFDRLRDVRDALGDLALAEAVHHASQGGTSRAGATLAAYQDGQLPPEVEVVRTPVAGVMLTHRVGVHFDPAATAPAGATPRAVADPPLDSWLAGLLPLAASVACVVSWDDPADGTAHQQTVTLNSLGLRPMDLVTLLNGQEQAMSELDDRVARQVVTSSAPRPDAALRISYRDGGGHIAVFEVAALAAHLSALLTAARPLRASDVVPPAEASHDLDAGAALDRTQLVAVQTVLGGLLADVTTYLATWEPRLADLTGQRAAILSGADTAAGEAVELLARGALLAVPGSGWGQVYASRRAAYSATVAGLRDRAARWQDRLTEIGHLLAAYDALPNSTPAADRLAELARIESLIRPAVATQNADPGIQRAAVGALRDAFANRRLAVLGVANGSAPGLVPLRTAVLGLLPFTDVDSDPYDFGPLEEWMISLVQDVVAAVRSLSGELGRRATAAQGALDAEAAAADGPGRVQALQECATALLGDTARPTPVFTLPAASAAEWTQALGSVDALLSHLTGDLGAVFPAEDWLHSAARVRTPLRHLEQTSLLAEALGQPGQELVPVQLPVKPDDRWLAMEYPTRLDLTGEHLLYSAWYGPGFAAGGPICGLLIDEWTEVLPSDTATAGLAFNYDQPGSEAPQAMLLVTPADGGTAWSWDDLRQAVPDTMRLAKQRTVEPVHLEASAAARFLPATVSAITKPGISIGLALDRNNGVELERLEVPRD
jgi:hypothetical protein